MTKIIAHRGASHEEPENTFSSIQKAIEIGVDFVELDVHLSGDGVPVVIHDHTLCRTTNAEKGKFVRKTHYHEIKALDAGSWFKGYETEEVVPTLEEILKLDFKGIGLMVEVKDDIQHDLIHKVMELVTKYSSHQYLIGSFSAETLRFVAEKYPEQPIIAIIDKFEEIETFKDLPVSNIAANYQVFFHSSMDSWKSSAIFWAWTVDDLKVAEDLIAWGVSGIITNRPREIKNRVQAFQKALS